MVSQSPIRSRNGGLMENGLQVDITWTREKMFGQRKWCKKKAAKVREIEDRNSKSKWTLKNLPCVCFPSFSSARAMSRATEHLGRCLPVLNNPPPLIRGRTEGGGAGRCKSVWNQKLYFEVQIIAETFCYGYANCSLQPRIMSSGRGNNHSDRRKLKRFFQCRDSNPGLVHGVSMT